MAIKGRKSAKRTPKKTPKKAVKKAVKKKSSPQEVAATVTGVREFGPGVLVCQGSNVASLCNEVTPLDRQRYVETVFCRDMELDVEEQNERVQALMHFAAIGFLVDSIYVNLVKDG